jgi:hypothetical protein
MINFPILTFHGTRLKFWDAGMSPAKGEEKRKPKKKKEREEKNKRQGTSLGGCM